MTLTRIASPSLTVTLALVFSLNGAPLFAQAPAAQLALTKAKVTIEGTSNVHDWTATSTTVRVAQARVAADAKGAGFWDAVVKPGAIESFEIVIPVATLTSPRRGLDKNMYKALKSDQHKDITFRLKGLTPKAAAGAFTAAGVLRVAGVDRDVTLDLTLGRAGQNLVVRGSTELLMTDFGIDPPSALFGTVRSSPNVTITFETVVSSPRT
jgi:polyisoprenoid-binding protein YceI